MNINKCLTINGRKMVFFILYFTIIMETLIAEFKFPQSIRYLNDIAIFFILLLMNVKFFKTFNESNNTIIVFGIGLFFITSTISALFNFVPVRLFIWALRNSFRGIILLFAATVYLNENDLSKIFDTLLKLQIINLLLALYQFFILNHKMDDIGGIFGYGNGAGVNIFNALLIAYYLNKYLYEKKGFLKLFFVIVSSIIIAAVAEEKMTYIMFGIIFLISVLFSKFSFKKLIAVLIGILGMVIGLFILKYYYPDMYEIMTDFDLLIKYSQTTYEEGYRIPRLGAFKFISNNFFDSTFNEIFGLGFGNGETSNIAIFQSDFYNRYGSYNYRWFTHQWIFLESGYLGILSFILMFGTILISLIKKIRKATINQKIYLITSICMGICCIITIWYNATLKVDMEYLAYFSVAIGLVATNKKICKKYDETDQNLILKNGQENNWKE